MTSVVMVRLLLQVLEYTIKGVSLHPPVLSRLPYAMTVGEGRIEEKWWRIYICVVLVKFDPTSQ